MDSAFRRRNRRFASYFVTKRVLRLSFGRLRICSLLLGVLSFCLAFVSYDGYSQKERNARNTRMDAALDAMRQFGFPERVVRVTVRELLEVYTEEWHFIEADAYTTLIEALLEKQNQRETKEVEASTSSGKDGDTSTVLIARPSSGVALSEHGAEAAVSDVEAAESSSRVDEALPLAATLPILEIDCPPGFEGYRSGCKDVSRDHDSGGGRQASASTRNGEASKDILQSTICLLPSYGSVPRVVANGVHLRSRKCYHGWIGGEEDAENMQPAPPLLPEFLSEFFSKMEKQRPWGQRKRRWDVRPEDL